LYDEQGRVSIKDLAAADVTTAEGRQLIEQVGGGRGACIMHVLFILTS
jgi:hypothetical protein